MKLLKIAVYSEASNHAIVTPPGRQFPGAVVQGDSLSILCAEARTISMRLKDLGITDEELLHTAQEHQEKLLNRLLHYQTVLATHGIELPYSPTAAASDLITLVPEADN